LVGRVAKAYVGVAFYGVMLMVTRRGGVDPIDDPTDPELLTPEERMGEVAAILAKGAVRLCVKAGGGNSDVLGDGGGSRNYRDSSKFGLELSSKKRLHVQRG